MSENSLFRFVRSSYGISLLLMESLLVQETPSVAAESLIAEVPAWGRREQRFAAGADEEGLRPHQTH